MKTTELRIGNHIHGLNSDEETIICKVVSLDSVGSAEYPIMFETEGSNEEYLSDLSGILLTEEWMIKFGFVDVGNKDFLIAPPTKHIACFKAGINSKFGYFSWGNIALLEIEIVYVHQLQNLYFALTGVELQLSST